jgi:predicted RND superfamily exporter protein
VRSNELFHKQQIGENVMSVMPKEQLSTKSNTTLVESDHDERIVKLVSVFCVVIAMAVVGVWSFNVLKVKTSYSVSQFLPPNHPILKISEKVSRQFHLSTEPPLIAILDLPAESLSTWLTKNRLQRLQTVTHVIEHVRGVQRAISLATIEGAVQSDGAINVGVLTELTPKRQWHDRFLTDPLLSPALISKDGRSAMVVVEPKRGDLKRTEAMIASVRLTLGRAFPEAKVQLGGPPAIQTGAKVLLEDEMTHFVLLSILACAVTLLIIFRSLSCVILPLILTGFANVAVFAWMGWAGIPFTILSSTIPILIFITVVGLCAHVMLRLAEEHERTPEVVKSTLVIESNRTLFLPNLLGALTTCVGFLTLFFNDSPLIRNYGLAVAGAVMTAWLTTSLLIIPFSILFPVPKPRRWVQERARWSLWIMRHRRAVVIAVAGLVVVAGYEGTHLSWTARLFDDLPAQNEARASSDRVDQALGGIMGLDIVVRAQKSGAWNDPKRLQKLSALLERMRRTDGVGSAKSVTDFLPMTAASKSRNQKSARVPASRGEAAELYFLYSLSSSDPLRQYVTADGRGVRIELRLHDLPSDHSMELVDQLVAQTRKTFATDAIESAGIASNIHSINNSLSRDLMFGFWQSLVLVACLLVVVYRSLRWALVACLPNLIPPIVLFGYLGATGTPVKPGIALIFSIALGLAFLFAAEK